MEGPKTSQVELESGRVEAPKTSQVELESGGVSGPAAEADVQLGARAGLQAAGLARGLASAEHRSVGSASRRKVCVYLQVDLQASVTFH